MLNRKLIYLLLIIALVTTSCGRSEIDKLAQAAKRGEASYKLYKTADYATAKAALLDFIEFLKKLIADSPSADNRTYVADIFISYVRLAKLEEKNGGPDKEKYMAEAISYCHQVQFKKDDCSAETTRKAVDLMDQVPVK